jgi:hypothetical protein
MSNFTVTEKNRVKRRPDRGRYDKSTIYEIIEEASAKIRSGPQGMIAKTRIYLSGKVYCL